MSEGSIVSGHVAAQAVERRVLAVNPGTRVRRTAARKQNGYFEASSRDCFYAPTPRLFDRQSILVGYLSLSLEPIVADHGQAGFAVAGDEHVDEIGDRLWVSGHRVRPPITSGTSKPALVTADCDATEIEHGEDVRRANFVLQRETEHVELAERCERLPTVERQVSVLAQLWAPSRSGGRERAFTDPVVSVVHQRVEHLHAVVAHAERVCVGEGKRKLSSHGRVVFDDRIQFAAHVLSRSLDSG